MNHLQRLSDSLNLSLDQLLAAAGFPIINEKVHSDTFIQAVEEIETTLKVQEVYDGTFSQTKLKQKLNKYETYSRTNEGKETISAKFEKKMETLLNGVGPFLQHLKDMYSLFMTGRGTSRELMLIGARSFISLWITGIPLPFISYGGPSLVFMMISAGILVNLSPYVKRNPYRAYAK